MLQACNLSVNGRKDVLCVHLRKVSERQVGCSDAVQLSCKSPQAPKRPVGRT